jgi:hypothetical protein
MCNYFTCQYGLWWKLNCYITHIGASFGDPPCLEYSPLIKNSQVDDLLGLTYATISTVLHINCDLFALNLFLLMYWMLLVYYHFADKVSAMYL